MEFMSSLYAVLGALVFLLSMAMVFRTRTMLRFRSSGTIQPGSISDWRVQVWRLMAGVMATMALIFVYVSLVEL
jgi:hypothetical protein